MRVSKSACLFIVAWLLGYEMWVTPIAMAQNQTTEVLDKQITTTVTCEYLLYLPKDYGKSERKWPLVLFLHGAGERGANLDLVKTHGPPKLIQQGKEFPFIVVSPQCPQGIWWPEIVDTLAALLDEVRENYAVDSDRVYLTGLSMGGYGTWTLACRYPERFAAIAPVCGGGLPFLAERPGLGVSRRQGPDRVSRRVQENGGRGQSCRRASQTDRLP